MNGVASPALRHVTSSISDGTHGTFARCDEGISLLSAKNVQGGALVTGMSESRISAADFYEITKNGNFRRGDVLLTIVGSIGRVAMLDTEEPLAFQRSVASLRPDERTFGRFLYWALQAKNVQEDLLGRARQAAQAGVYLGDVAAVRVPCPNFDEQRRIADFLDDQVALLDQAINLRQRQIDLVNERALARAYAAVLGINEPEARHAVGTDWIGSVPEGWSVQPLGRLFDAQLGKMLAPDRLVGTHVRPYLRNTNVQWDRIDTHDLKEMDFPPHERQRYEVLPGDLLVCEGGDVGRAAIWNGAVEEVYFQKALHRLRPSAHVSARWVFYVLRVATRLGVFATSGTSTIAHLTSEQLRAQRMPFAPPEVERRLIDMLDSEALSERRLLDLYGEQSALLRERKQALITAAVTCEFDVTTTRRMAS